ncbi:MAG: hypothetical protein KDI44_10555 [Thiothrix sp.]|nr:hypothetical protein [Thiothrix sp.]HPQ94049.1 hypothetical protein [Thiolinea sp.]
MRGILLGLVLLFASVGWLIWRIGAHDPAPRTAWVTTEGEVAGIRVTDSRKSGRVLTLELRGDPDRFGLSFLERIPGLEQRLSTRVTTGTRLALETVAREQARAMSAAPLTLTILVLRVEDEVLYDRDDYSSHWQGILFLIGRGAALLAWLVAGGLLWVLVRMPA